LQDKHLPNTTAPTLPAQPLTKVVLKLESSIENSRMSQTTPNSEHLPVKTFINCDLRYFNLKFLTDRLGSFDVVMLDPPWRLKGGEKNDTPYMFSNSIFQSKI